jgi:dTDP-4-dehydrorhamnose reductase
MTLNHLVIGQGNLAASLVEIIDQRYSFSTVGLAQVVEWLQHNDFRALRNVDFIWCCIGGDYHHARENARQSHVLNVTLPRLIQEHADQKSRLCFISTLEACHPEYQLRPYLRTPEPTSEWVSQKCLLEAQLSSLNRPNTAYVRIGAPYGPVYPASTFPGRLLAINPQSGSALLVPRNEVVPTPTDWIAEMLVGAIDNGLWNESTYTCHHVTPTGSISAFDWSRLILSDLDSSYWLDKITWDVTRPRMLVGNCTLAKPPHWSTLWSQYYRREDYQRF